MKGWYFSKLDVITALQPLSTINISIDSGSSSMQDRPDIPMDVIWSGSGNRKEEGEGS
jgi:hypothetical protein